MVKKCDICQRHGPLIHVLASDLISIGAPCHFFRWGIDTVGPFVKAVGHKKFLVVAVDYFTKWVEAEPLSRITEDEIMKFIWRNIFCRFGIPRILISENGTQFNGKKITDWCMEFGIRQKFVLSHTHKRTGRWK